MNLKEFSTEELIKEIKDREESEKQFKILIDKQALLQNEISKLSEQIRSFSSYSKEKTINHIVKIKPEKYVIQKLAVGETVLKDRIKEILTRNNRPMRTKEIVSELQSSGWKTQSKDPYYPVATMLASNPSLFIRVKKGLYGLREA